MASEWLNLIFGLVALIPIVAGCYFITHRNRQKQKLIDLIILSKVYSVSRLVSLSGIRQDRAIRYIQEVISHANASGLGSNREWRVLRGAQLNFDSMEIIPAEEIEPTVMEGAFNTLKNAVSSKFAQQVPKEPWVCPYCDTKNSAETLDCSGCNTKRQM